MAKPGDFFVSVTDLFSIILPGTATAYILLKVEEHKGMDLLSLRTLGGKTEGYVAFFVVAYLLGHLTDMVGATILDWIYDHTYRTWRGGSFRAWLRGTGGHRSAGRIGLLDLLFDASQPTNTLLHRAKQLSQPGMPSGDRVYQWSRAWVQIKSPGVFGDTERLQANSKFFRGFVIVAIISAVLAPCLIREFHSGPRIVCIVLALVAFLRYADLRWKAVQHVYRCFIALRSESPPPQFE